MSNEINLDKCYDVVMKLVDEGGKVKLKIK